MNKKVLFVSGLLLLSGCSTFVDNQYKVAPTGKAVTQIEKAKQLPIKMDKEIKIAVTAQTQVLDIYSIDSPGVIFDLPMVKNGLAINIEAEVNDSVFVPSAKVINQSGDIRAELDDEGLVYLKPRLADGNRLQGNIKVHPQIGDSSLYLVIFTDKDKLNETVAVSHPAKLDAEGRGNYLPEVGDIQVPRALTGTFSIEATALGARNKAQSTILPALSATERPQQESVSFYHQAIRAAIADNDVDKAMGLLRDAEQLGITDADQVFRDAMKAQLDKK
ncbi:MalM family protein [Salinivibrio sp. ES.052]|uniref:MalM family protein n=1 Tax=Salinivibrio sp. ES.052 TaxID=1882823 RepID=UPI000926BB77|nr:MalM family protein [Salinivibrio sp. ES.052]SIO32430.1 maltose operon protein [Salinivibrio sp. ES.052]